MKVNGSDLKDVLFFDDDTNSKIEVKLSIRDIIFFRLLEKIIGALSK